MAKTQITEPAHRQPLRLWPGVVIVLLQWLVRFGTPVVAPDAVPIAVQGGFLGGLGIVVWWLACSRAPWPDRLGAPVLMIVMLLATPLILHESIATGMMGFMFPIYAIPPLCLAFVAWAALSRRLPSGMRRASMAATIVLACAAWALFRTGGVTGGLRSDLAWRWSDTPEERLLARMADAPAPRPPAPPPAERPSEPLAAQAVDEVAATPAADPPVADAVNARLAATDPPEPAPAPAAPADPEVVETAVGWPGFRGPARDGVIRRVRIATDWSVSPPVELWRRPIGPGWSSFAVDGRRLYTQEQRGDDEVVASYDAATGEPVWMHRDPVRFWESNGGAGPRATPTLSAGRVYSLGATGILNALDAGTGAVVWSRNAAVDAGAEVPYWGFAGSPLVVDDLVIVQAGSLVAYDRVTGSLRWSDGRRAGSYSSPHLATVDGVAQILQLSGAGVAGVAPADGARFWEHSWAGSTIVQPALTADGDILIGTTGDATGMGIRRIAVSRGPEGWTVEERWTSRGLKPYFNDFVVHDGHAFGFDGRILSCIDLEDGARTWKGGRYGSGQLVLLSDQGLLLVLSEDGDLALVEAKPDQYTELAKFPAIEGKTWNHPALVGDVLLVRNGEEMVAFRLPLADR